MQITLEHAVTYEEQAKGLMHRESMPENHGMAFSYEAPKTLIFWSKNCLMDLDLAYLDANHVIQEIYLLTKEPLTRITSKFPAQYAVEMNAGFFERNEVVPGDQIVWESSWPNGEIKRRAPALQKKSEAVSLPLSQ